MNRPISRMRRRGSILAHWLQSACRLPLACGLLLGGFLLPSGLARAEVPASAEAFDDAVPAAADAPQRVVVLRNGHALVGGVEQAGDRMTITQGPGRSVRVPIRDVDLVVDTLHDAYLHRRQRLHPGEIQDQMRLAQWCLRYQLEDEAAELLLEMARRHPNHHSVRALERQMGERAGLLAGSGRGGKSAVRTASFQQAEVAADASGFPLDVPPVPEDSGELPNLSAAEITEFTRVIQPLLQNRCGNATCHAPNGRSAFVLQRTPTGRQTFKDLTWSNLRAAWKQVDGQVPERSRLIAMATTPHGGQSRAPLETYESRPLQRLSRWVVSAAHTDAMAAVDAPTPTGGLNGLGLPMPAGPLGGGQAGFTDSASPAGAVTFGPKAAPLTPLQRLQAAGARVTAAQDAVRAGTPDVSSSVGSPGSDAGVQRASFLEAVPTATAQPGQTPPAKKPASGGGGTGAVAPSAGDPFDPAAFNARYHPE